MKTTIQYCSVLLVYFFSIFSTVVWAEADQYWQCGTKDKNNVVWTLKNAYERRARSQTMDACKKQSATPASCKTDCEEFIHGFSTKPKWKCTALDENATPWTNQEDKASLDEAGMEAQKRCNALSPLPASCYLSSATCENLNPHS